MVNSMLPHNQWELNNVAVQPQQENIHEDVKSVFASLQKVADVGQSLLKQEKIQILAK